MKKQQLNLFTEMSKETIENLTQVVNETLENGVTCNSHKPFTSIDMWNIHRQRKTLAMKRQFA